MKRPAFQFYPGDWLSSTDITVMSIAEEGAYHRLLCHAWKQEDCGVPDDDKQLAILSKLGGAWKRSADTIRRKFVSRDGRLYNERLLIERDKQEEWARKSANGGRMAGSKHHTKEVANTNHPSGLLPGLLPTKPIANPVANHIANGYSSSLSLSSSLSSEFSTNVENKIKNITASGDAEVEVFTLVSPPEKGDPAPPAAVPETPKRKSRREKADAQMTPQQNGWFEEWWGIYWLKKARQEARYAFAKWVLSQEFFDTIMAATRAQLPEMEEHERKGHGIPFGASWLNGKRWDDEVSCPTTDGAPRSGFMTVQEKNKLAATESFNRIMAEKEQK